MIIRDCDGKRLVFGDLCQNVYQNPDEAYSKYRFAATDKDGVLRESYGKGKWAVFVDYEGDIAVFDAVGIANRVTAMRKIEGE